MNLEHLGHLLGAVFSGNMNISLFTLPLAWMMGLVPRLFAIHTYAAATGKPAEFDHARSLLRVASSDPSLPPRTRGRIIRAEAAARDIFESAPLFAVAILAGNQVRLPGSLLNILGLSYLVTRMAYIDACIFGENAIVARLRSILYFIAHTITCSLLILVGLRT